MSVSAPAPLSAEHDLEHFDCGHASLNAWLQRHALSNQERRAARTFVVCEGRRVVGYYALAAGSVVHSEATGNLRRNMPDPVPMALLGRLAVDLSMRGKGLGVGMLQDAVTRILQASDTLGVRGILVDAIDENAKAFYMRFGFRPSSVLPMKLMVTLTEIQRALEKS